MDNRLTLQSLIQYLSGRIDRILRFGVLVPWANVAMETELPLLLPHKVTWHFARLIPPSLTTEISDDFLSGMIDAIPSALHSLSRIPLDGIAFGCTSASFSYSSRVHQYQDESGDSFITAFDAICYVLKFLNIQKITLITPYQEPITRKEVQALKECGFQLVNDFSLGFRDNIDCIKMDELIKAYDKCSSKNTDAILISCTALHTLETIYALEKRTSKPIISSNIAIALALILKSNPQVFEKGEIF